MENLSLKHQRNKAKNVKKFVKQKKKNIYEMELKNKGN